MNELTTVVLNESTIVSALPVTIRQAFGFLENEGMIAIDVYRTLIELIIDPSAAVRKQEVNFWDGYTDIQVLFFDQSIRQFVYGLVTQYF